MYKIKAEDFLTIRRKLKSCVEKISKTFDLLHSWTVRFIRADVFSRNNSSCFKVVHLHKNVVLREKTRALTVNKMRVVINIKFMREGHQLFLTSEKVEYLQRRVIFSSPETIKITHRKVHAFGLKTYTYYYHYNTKRLQAPSPELMKIVYHHKELRWSITLAY